MAELCEAANKEVAADQAVRIANYLCNGNYAVSGGLAGIEAVEKLAKSFKARWAGRGAEGRGLAWLRRAVRTQPAMGMASS